MARPAASRGSGSRPSAVEITLPPLHPHQREVADDTHRFKILACGRRWGKTKMCSAICIARALKGQRCWWIGNVNDTATIGFREAKALAEQLPIPKRILESSPRTIEFPTGGSITFKSADSESLRGEGLDFVVFDEADYQNEAVWTEEIRPALSDRKGHAIFISTPQIEGGWFHRLWQEGQLDKPDIKSWQFTSYDNPYLDPEEIDKAKEELPSIVFRREFLAEFVSSAGARIKREWIKYVDAVPQKSYITMGVDLAISEKTTADYTAIGVLSRDSEGKIYVVDVQRIRGSFQDQLNFVKSMASKWQPRVIGVEDVQYQRVMVQQLSRETVLNIRAYRPDRDKVARFSPLEARYERGEVYHLRGLSNAFEAELLSFPLSEHDDQVDSLSIAFSMLGFANNQSSGEIYSDGWNAPKGYTEEDISIYDVI